MSKKAGKEKHPLFNTWAHAKRTKTMGTIWSNDFWLFVEEVGNRPENTRLFRKDISLKLDRDNFYWKEIKLTIQDYESRAAYMREYMRQNPDKQKNSDLKKRFGINLDTFQHMQNEQNYVCAICGNPETTVDNRSNTTRELAVDHCHTTGKIRGLLCRGCNQGLGNFRDNITYLKKAITYLERN